MFCHQCGRECSNEAKFCSECGAPIETAATIDRSLDWREATDFREIVGHPEVIDRIERVAGTKAGGMSADTFLKAAQPLMSLAGAGMVKLSAVADIAVPFYTRLGVKTQNELSRVFPWTFGETLAAALCALAARSQALNTIEEAENGCLIEAVLPSSMWNWEGQIVLTLEQQTDGIAVSANSLIPGQGFDWGRSKKVLKAFFEDMTQFRNG